MSLEYLGDAEIVCRQLDQSMAKGDNELFIETWLIACKPLMKHGLETLACLWGGVMRDSEAVKEVKHKARTLGVKL